MDRTNVAAQQARLAQYRKQMNENPLERVPISSAKEMGPTDGKRGIQHAPLRPEFEQSHDHAIDQSEKKGPQVSPQLRDQKLPKHAPQPKMAPKPPQSVGPEVDRQAHYERAAKLNEAIKAGQQQADRGNMKDGKDHD